MNKNKKNVEAVGDSAHDLMTDLKTDLANLGSDAVRLAADYLGPKAHDIADYVAPRVADLGQRGARLAEDTRDAVAPKVQQLAETTREGLRPYLDDARDKVQPLVDTAQDRLNKDVMPHLQDAYDQIAANPQAQEARKRMLAAKAALAGDLALPEPAEKRSVGKTILQVILASGLLAGVVYAVKRFLAPEDSGWQAHEPSKPYRSREEFLAATADEVADAAEQAETPTVGDTAVPVGADPFQVSPYGEGSYVGTEPPADFVIKGNERSMKYHVEGSGGYDRTIADVWFNSPEAAEAAGFTRAQR